MPTCSQFYCKNVSGKSVDSSGQKISFHKFPDKIENPALYKKWCSSMKRKNFVPSKYAVVCSEHFVPDDFDKNLMAELMQGAKQLGN